MAVLAGAILWGKGDGGIRRVGGAFSLVDTDGRTVTDRDFRGRWVLVYFGYTSCPDVCPLTLHDMAEALERLGPKGARVQPVFVTVDPQRDTPAVLRAYAASIDPRLVALTGPEDAVATTLRAFRVQREIRHVAGQPHDDYLLDHTAVLFLLGPDGRFIAPVRADEPPDRMAAAIGAHVS